MDLKVKVQREQAQERLGKSNPAVRREPGQGPGQGP